MEKQTQEVSSGALSANKLVSDTQVFLLSIVLCSTQIVATLLLDYHLSNLICSLF